MRSKLAPCLFLAIVGLCIAGCPGGGETPAGSGKPLSKASDKDLAAEEKALAHHVNPMAARKAAAPPAKGSGAADEAVDRNARE